MPDDKLLYTWLNSIESITPAKKNELLRHFGDIEALYNASPDDYKEIGIKSDMAPMQALSNKTLIFAESEISRAEDMGITLITQKDDRYPSSLLNLYDPPIMLYAVGDTSLLSNELSFCIVGSRHPSEYGITAAISVSSQLAQCGFTVVSGLAVGIDSAAHKGALRARGKTIGVAGCGLAVDYPSGNKALRDEIKEKGLIISEFSLDMNALAGNFPQRNRILSGLSLGVAVMEAGVRSGALITAKYAREQNKDVFALPGNITSPNSGGTNELIADGAQVLLSADAIIAEYMVRFPKLFEIGQKETEEIKAYSEEAYEAAVCFAEKEFDKKIVKALKKGELHVNEIVKLSGEDISKVNARLTMLQIKGIVREKPGRMYELN